MKLRTVTIWTTGLMLLLTTVTPIINAIGKEPIGSNSVVAGYINTFLVLWIFSGSPLVISLIIAWHLKYDIPFLILLLSTITYAILYAYMWFMTFFADGWMLLGLLFAGILMLPILIPAWIVAPILNEYYVKKSVPHPGTVPPSTVKPTQDNVK